MNSKDKENLIKIVENIFKKMAIDGFLFPLTFFLAWPEFFFFRHRILIS